MRCGPYTTAEEAAIRDLAELGSKAVAQILDRDVESVQRKASRLGISLKKKSQISVRFLSGREIDAISRHSEALLCPACGKAFSVASSGLCGLCHLEYLTDEHRQAYRRLVLEREYNVAKKQLSRKRKELGVRAPGRGGDAGIGAHDGEV